MKKFLCIFLSVSLVLTSSIFTYARPDKQDKGEKGKIESKQENKSDKKSIEKEKKQEVNNNDTDTETSIKDLKDQIKEASKDLDKMKKLLKELQKQNKKMKKNAPMIFIDGEQVEADVPPVIKDGRTLVPIRAISNGLKADVRYDSTTKTVTVTKAVYDDVYGTKNLVVEIKLGSNILKVNGVDVKIDAPSRVINNRTFVPIRAISQIFKMDINWDSQSGTVIILPGKGNHRPEPKPTESKITTPTATPVATPSTVASQTPTPTSTPVPATETPVPATPTPVPSAT